MLVGKGHGIMEDGNDLQEMTSLAVGSSRRRRKFSVVVMSGEIPLG